MIILEHFMTSQHNGKLKYKIDFKNMDKQHKYKTHEKYEMMGFLFCKQNIHFLVL